MYENKTQLVIRDNIALLSLKNAPVNALDLEFSRQLESFISGVKNSQKISALVLTGEQNTFCAGLNLKKVPLYSPAEQKEIIASFNRLLYELYSLPLPTIAAINGHAIAGGLILAVACDYRIGVNANFKMGLTEAKVGVPFPVVAMELAKGEVSKSFFRRMVLSGENINQNQALQEGLLDELCPVNSLLEKSLKKAADLSSMPAQSYKQIKFALKSDALAKMKASLSGENDLLFNNWLSADSKQAAASALNI